MESPVIPVSARYVNSREPENLGKQLQETLTRYPIELRSNDLILEFIEWSNSPSGMRPLLNAWVMPRCRG